MTATDEDLYAAARELTTGDLLPRLRALIPDEQTTLESSIGSHTKHEAPPIPWNTPAAMLYFEIHADARRYESQLTIRLFHRAKYRPGTDIHTTEAINRLPVLIIHGRAQGLDHLNLDDPTTALLSWAPRIRRLLGEPLEGEEPTMHVPGDARCPYCGNPLILGDGWKALEHNATAICRRCLDAHGKPLSWPITERIGHLQSGEQVTAPTAQQRYGIPQSTFATWKERGRIHPYGVDENQRPTYRVSDILTVLDTPNTAEVAS